MRVTTSKSKNSESFYITKSFIDNNGKSTSKNIRKLGTLKELSEKLNTDRNGVLAWAKEQARLETEKYKKEKEEKVVLIPFRADRRREHRAKSGNKHDHRQYPCQQTYLHLHSSSPLATPFATRLIIINDILSIY